MAPGRPTPQPRMQVPHKLGPGPEWSGEGTPELSEEDKAAAVAAGLRGHLRLGRRPAHCPPARRLSFPGEGVGCCPFQVFWSFLAPSFPLPPPWPLLSVS